ncbi:hypothetical protein EDB92DRAFT_1954696 [Lactarius akahatsu]|uniref:Uncharacterized protein n=1 Tax=Lactarius akahatsu TaxID=416441 RepID=A0AAD4LB53_9AGAM|nr:hypothetical protein EDB92DRAFT_1954696 [Lactarius akahatsu]
MPHPKSMAQMLCTSNLLVDLATDLFRPVEAARPTAQRPSAIMRDTLSAVLERLSVGSGKMKGHYICSLRTVADEADVVLLVLDAHDTNRGRGKLVEEQEDKRLVPRENAQAFTEGPPPHDPSDSLSRGPVR